MTDRQTYPPSAANPRCPATTRMFGRVHRCGKVENHADNVHACNLVVHYADGDRLFHDHATIQWTTQTEPIGDGR